MHDEAARLYAVAAHTKSTPWRSFTIIGNALETIVYEGNQHIKTYNPNGNVQTPSKNARNEAMLSPRMMSQNAAPRLFSSTTWGFSPLSVDEETVGDGCSTIVTVDIGVGGTETETMIPVSYRMFTGLWHQRCSYWRIHVPRVKISSW